ncbi:hypothetical protein H4R23_005663, partial [Coemansia sp. Cherry 401B]
RARRPPGRAERHPGRQHRVQAPRGPRRLEGGPRAVRPRLDAAAAHRPAQGPRRLGDQHQAGQRHLQPQL